jgi:hypothetical protein
MKQNKEVEIPLKAGSYFSRMIGDVLRETCTKRPGRGKSRRQPSVLRLHVAWQNTLRSRLGQVGGEGRGQCPKLPRVSKGEFPTATEGVLSDM